MATFGWVLLGAAFLIFIMVANQSWMRVWELFQNGLGPGNTRVPTPASPEEGGPPSLLPAPGEEVFEPAPRGNDIVQTPDNDNRLVQPGRSTGPLFG